MANFELLSDTILVNIVSISSQSGSISFNMKTSLSLKEIKSNFICLNFSFNLSKVAFNFFCPVAYILLSAISSLFSKMPNSINVVKLISKFSGIAIPMACPKSPIWLALKSGFIKSYNTGNIGWNFSISFLIKTITLWGLGLSFLKMVRSKRSKVLIHDS